LASPFDYFYFSLDLETTPIVIMNYKGGTTLKIKDVSEQLQISPDTLRYYEKIGLIRNVPRDKNGVRDYSEENCKSIAFIKCMRAANVSISGLTRYMELFEQGDATRKERREILIQDRKSVV